MGTILATTLITDAAMMANDTMNVRWTKAELLNWLNAGQRAIVALAPESGWVKSDSVKIAANAPGGQLPAGGISLISVIRDDKQVMRLVDKELIDSRYPTWMATTTVSEVKQAYMYDPRTPKQFWCWPVSSTERTVVIDYVATPTDCTLVKPSTAPDTSLIWLGDEYAEALVDFMLFRAYAKDTDPSSAQKAQLYYTAFANVVTGNRNVMQGNEPNKTVSSTVLNPNVAQHYARGA